MSVSDRKLAANRKNAKHSTGPKTQEGKSLCRFNALQHGLLAKEVILPGENAREFERLVAALVADWEPKGRVEEILLERIASLSWRLRRVARAESGAIRARLQRVAVQERERQAKHEEAVDSEDREELRQDWRGVAFLIDGIDRVLAELAGPTSNDPDECADLSGEKHEWVLEYLGLDSRSVGCATFKKWVEVERRDLVKRRRELKREAQGALVAKKAALAIPSARAADRLMRYETAIDRQLHRAITQLAFIQLQRSKVSAQGGGQQGRGVRLNRPIISQLAPVRIEERPQLPE
jgi:hypothetical protein